MEKQNFFLRYLNPLTDFGFHKIFGTEESKDLLIDFLNQVIKEEGLITDIKYLPPENLGVDENDRKAIFDIYCITEKGEYFVVEMQRAKQKYFRDRSLFYASFPIQRQALRGDKWDYQLKAVYVVSVLNFVLFNEFEEDKEQIVEHVHLIRDRTKTLFSPNLNFIFVELPKFRKTKQELTTNFDRWLYVLKNLHGLEDRPIEIGGKIFDKLFKLAEIKQLTKDDMEYYRRSILESNDILNMIDYAREEGEEKGREIGRRSVLESNDVRNMIDYAREEGEEIGRKSVLESNEVRNMVDYAREEEKVSVIQKCFQRNMPIEDIIFLTGFSKEQIINYTLNG
jgi:predicted transposase/invertase (TIGR01784 family)